MPWYLAILSTTVAVDAQKDPIPALLAAAAIAVVLWFLVSQARRRDERRKASGRDLSGWRSRQPPR